MAFFIEACWRRYPAEEQFCCFGGTAREGAMVGGKGRSNLVQEQQLNRVEQRLRNKRKRKNTAHPWQRGHCRDD